MPDLHCKHASRNSRQAYMSKKKQCLEKIRSSGEVACVISGKTSIYAFIAMEMRTFFQYDKRAETFISAFDGSTYEGCMPIFSRAQR